MSSSTPSYFKVIANLVHPARSFGRFDHTDAAMTRTGKGSETLVILLHGFASRPYDMRSLVPVIDRAYGEPDLFVPGLPMHFFSFHDPLALCRSLLGQIDVLYEENRYQRIVVVGHSFGSLIARKLVVCAFGSTDEAPLEAALGIDSDRPWRNAIERVILLAGMNRGWSISRHLSIPNMIVWRIGIVLGYLLAIFQRRLPMIFKVRRGANFITQLRLQWLALRQRKHSIPTIQLLGSVDDVVSPSDNVDSVTGSDFVYLDVPQSGHLDILNMSPTRSDGMTPFPQGAARAAILYRALKEDMQHLRDNSLQPFDSVIDASRDDVAGVVFVVHGIRDLGFWTSKIARRAVREARRHEQQFATETSSYGYFAMLPFLLPWLRRQKVEWLMDRYAECTARYPRADFHFVGHSNGTYLLARALEEYPCARFKRAVLAGSVIRTDFDWDKFRKAGQLEEIVNYVATSDWVLAVFPKAFERLDHVVRRILRRQQGPFDLGGAGHDGFAGGLALPDVAFVVGGHGAALQEQFWGDISRFIVHGTPPGIPAELQRRTLNRFWRLIGKLAPLPLACIAAFVVYVTYLLATREALLGFDLTIEWLRTILLVVWAWALYVIVTWI